MKKWLKLALLCVATLALTGYDDDEAWIPDDDAEVYGEVEQGLTCRKGCRCGNSCISCSKRCHKGSGGGCGG